MGAISAFITGLLGDANVEGKQTSSTGCSPLNEILCAQPDSFFKIEYYEKQK